MSELLTAALTAFFAILVLVAGQFIEKFFVIPLIELRKTLGEIHFAYTFYGNVEGEITPSEKKQEASQELRKLAASLRREVYAVPMYGLFSFLHLIPSKSILLKSSVHLIGWSNSLSKDPGQHRDALGKIMGWKN